MSTYRRYDPFREALSLRRAMDQLFEQSFVHPSLIAGEPALLPPMDIYETNNGYEVDVALPGVRPEDIELIVDQNILTIRGRYSHQNEHQNQPEAQTEGQQQTQPGQTQGQPSQQQSQDQQGRTERHRQGHTWLSREIVSGSFERTITFPKPIDADKITTNYQYGILTINIPLSEASSPKKISVSVQQSSQPLPFEEAQERVRRAVNEMEKAINEANDTPGLQDATRREYLSKQCMSFLEEEFGVAREASSENKYIELNQTS